jgi:hypothetical protein
MLKLSTLFYAVILVALLSPAGALAQPDTPPDLPMQYIPPTTVTLAGGGTQATGGFFVGIYEVSNANYASCVEAGACTPPQYTALDDGTPYYEVPDFADYPVLGVDWSQAATFCDWAGMRLPTSDEWLAAAAWDPAEGRLRPYPWGDIFTGNEANFALVGAAGGPAPVDAYARWRSPYHLYNMAGNAAEWVAEGLLAGGSWLADPEAFSPNAREAPEVLQIYSGFRCAYSCPACEVAAAPTEAAAAPTDLPTPTATVTATPEAQPTPAATEATGDAYDADLQAVLPETYDGAASVDISRVAVTQGNAAGSGGVSTISPSGGGAQDAGAWGTVFGDPVPAGEPVSGIGPEVFTAGDRMLAVDSVSWDVTFNTARVDIAVEQRAAIAVQQTDGAEATGVVIDLGDTFAVRLEGADAAIDYDDVEDSLTLTLVTGTAALTAPVSQPFAMPADGETALLVQVDAAGTIQAEEIPLSDAAERFPPAFRSLTFHIEMLEPIAVNRDEADLVWHVMLDLDGNPGTGLASDEQTNAMYAGLGADFITPARLQENGEVAGIGFFPEAPGDTETIPVSASLSADRRLLTVHIPLAALQANAEAAGLPFTAENLHWRVAAINHDGNAEPTDLYPELDFAYTLPSEGLPEPVVIDATEIPEPVETEVAPVELAEPTEPGVCRSVTQANVNLRGGPGTEFVRVGGLDGNTEVKIVGVNASGDWYKVDVEGIDEAWIAGFLLDYFWCPEGVQVTIIGE